MEGSSDVARASYRGLTPGRPAFGGRDDLDVEPAHVAKFFGLLLGRHARVSSQHDHRRAVTGMNLEIRFGFHFICIHTSVSSRNISRNTAIVIDEHYIPSFKPAKIFVNKIKNSDKVKQLAEK